MKRTIGILAILAFCGALLAPQTRAQNQKPIKIGAFFALSGPAAFIGTPTKLVAQMAVDEINKKGGINGRPIKLIFGDTEGDPTKAVMIVKKFINVDKVDAIIGPTRTGTGMAVKRIIERAHVPTIMTVGGDPVIMEGGRFGTARWIFKTPQRSSTAVKKVMGYLKSKGITKIGMITASDGFGQDGKRQIERLAPRFGITIVAKESFAPRDTDMTSQLSKIAAKKPQAIICWTIGPAGAIVAKNVKQLGIKVPLVQCHGLPGPKYIQLAGKAAEGNIMPATKLMCWMALPNSDPQKKVIAHFVHLYNDVYHFNTRFPINTHSGYAWDAINILARAMAKVGTNKEKLRTAIEHTKNYVGISGVYNMSPKDHNGLNTSSMVIVTVHNGAWRLAQY